jgi:hypothetical protein
MQTPLSRPPSYDCALAEQPRREALQYYEQLKEPANHWANKHTHSPPRAVVDDAQHSPRGGDSDERLLACGVQANYAVGTTSGAARANPTGSRQPARAQRQRQRCAGRGQPAAPSAGEERACAQPAAHQAEWLVFLGERGLGGGRE